MAAITTENNGYSQLVSDIGAMLSDARKQLAVAVNNVLVETYWHIGKHIVEYDKTETNAPNTAAGCLTVCLAI